MTNYPAHACRAKLFRPWVPSWDRLPMVLATGSSRLTFMTWTDIASTQWHTSRVDPIEEPLIPAFLCQVKTESSITEELKKIYELKFHGSVPLTPVIFKCHWFDPTLTRHTPSVGLVEIRQDSMLQGEDVYIVAQQAIQVYYLSYSCQTDHRLRGWDVVYKVSPHGKLPFLNNKDYNNVREFFQE